MHLKRAERKKNDANDNIVSDQQQHNANLKQLIS